MKHTVEGIWIDDCRRDLSANNLCRVRELELEGASLREHALELAVQHFLRFPKVFLAQATEACPDLPDVAEAHERLADLDGAHGVIFDEGLQKRTHLVERSTVELGGTVGKFVVCAKCSSQ